MLSPKNRVCAERKPKTYHIWDTRYSRTIMEIVISYYQIRPIYGSEVSKRSHFWGTCSWGRGRGTDFTRTLLICIHSKTKTFQIRMTRSSRTIMEIVISYYQIRPIFGSEVSKRSHFCGTCSWGHGRGTNFTRTFFFRLQCYLISLVEDFKVEEINIKSCCVTDG